MDKAFISLIKQIYESKDLTIEPLGIKFRNLSAGALATVLYPLLVLEHEETELINKTFDVKRLKKIAELNIRFKKENLMRLALIAGEKDQAFQKLKKEYLIIEDEYNQTIITKDEIFLTIKGNKRQIVSLLEKFDILFLGFSYDTLYHYDGVMKTKYINELIFQKLRPRQINASPFMFYTLLNSMGFTHVELQFIDGLHYVDEKYFDLLIEHSNSNFVKTYVDEVFKKGLDYFSRNSNSKFYHMNKLLENYPITILENFTFNEALKVYGCHK